MDYKTVTIESSLKLPMKLIDIEKDAEHFIFEFLEFDKNQSDYSIKMGGITGKFGIRYSDYGINCEFPCDITVGNVFEFYENLKQGYGQLDGTAALRDYTGDRFKMTIAFHKHGHCVMNGTFKNKNNLYKSGITILMYCDQTYIGPSITSLEQLFTEFAKIQGNTQFLY